MKEFYSILRVSGSSLVGKDNDKEAVLALEALGFQITSSHAQKGKVASPKTGERLILEADRKMDTAGSFCLYRFLQKEWKKVLSGRIIGFNKGDATHSKTFTCVNGTFSNLSFTTPTDAVASSLDTIPPEIDLKEKMVDIIVNDNDGGEIANGERVVLLRLDDIRRFEGQPRIVFNKDRLMEIGSSIKNIGQLKAISVWRLSPEEIQGDGCHYELDDGERRCLSMRMVGLSTIKAIIKSGNRPSTLERFVLSFVANLHAEPHSPYEIAKALLYLYGEVKDVTEIHQKTGMHVATIQNYLKLRNLSPNLLEKMSPNIPKEKRLRLEHAKQLSGLKSHEEQEKIYVESYENSSKDVRVTARSIKMLVATSDSVLNFAPRKSTTRKVASRAVQRLLSAVVDLGSNSDGLEKHLLFVSPEGRKDIETSMKKALELLPKLLEIVRI